MREAEAERQATQDALASELAAERRLSAAADGALREREAAFEVREAAHAAAAAAAHQRLEEQERTLEEARARLDAKFPPAAQQLRLRTPPATPPRATPPPTPPGQYDTAPESPESPATGSSPEAVRAARQADAAQRAAKREGMRARREVLREERAEREAKLEQLGLLPGDSLSMRADDAEYAHLGRG